jgi:light-regulated signal transduction histidine kinase (bacteriophytochrome)
LRNYQINLLSLLSMKSVKSSNPCKSVIQTKEIIVKAHGGELNVETKEGEGSIFTIQLPVSLS